MDTMILKDNSQKLSLFIFIFSMSCMYILAFTIPDTQYTQTNLMISMSIFVLPVIYKTLPFMNEQCEIIINDNEIRRHWGDEIIEIKWSSNVIVEKTFIDFFDNRQAESSWQRYVGAVFNIFIENPLTLIAKVIYRLFTNGLRFYKLFDTIMIRDNEKMIAILINNQTDYENLKDFLFNKGIDINSLSIFYTPFYLSLESISRGK